MLVVGEMDNNVPPESTYRLVDALIKAGKVFELLVVPGAGHGTRGPSGSYVQRRLQNFFLRHLQGAQPSQESQAPEGSR
jgi:dipeptidyl aminopeptidase/acylaminoacyl peptidase